MQPFDSDSADRWPDETRLSNIEPRCKACGKRGADVRPDFHWQAKPVGGDGLPLGGRSRCSIDLILPVTI
jgi:hypothetical protein